jgi:hypothetical protein
MALHALLLLADVGPQLVQLDTADTKPDHYAVVQLGASAPDTSTKAHDRIAMNASDPLDGADRHALGEGGDDFNLPVAGEDVHGGPNPSC